VNACRVGEGEMRKKARVDGAGNVARRGVVLTARPATSVPAVKRPRTGTSMSPRHAEARQNHSRQP